LLRINCDADADLIAVAKVACCCAVSLLSGSSVPLSCLEPVDRHAATHLIAEAKIALRTGIASLGLGTVGLCGGFARCHQTPPSPPHIIGSPTASD
jgi:hypothetical protein